MNYNPTLHKLSNGVTVILDPMDAATAHVIVGFQTGSRNESPAEAGLTHFCEHMLCKGTKRFPTAKSITDYVEDNAGCSNAHTASNRIYFDGTILSENTELLLDVFADQLQNSVFDADVLERERAIIADELRRKLDNQENQSVEFLVRHVLKGNFSIFRTLGTFENIATFTRKQMKMFMSRRFSGKNCVICVSGKIDNPEKLLASIKQKFSWLLALDVPQNMVPTSYIPAVAHMPLPDKQNVEICIFVPELYKLNAENNFKRMCANRFQDYLTQELFRVLRTENGLVYGVQPEAFQADGMGLTGFTVKTAPENVKRLMELMTQTARDALTTNPITDEYLKRFYNRLRLGDALFLESPERRCSRLWTRYNDCGDLLDYHATLRMASEITAADVMRYARGFFDAPVSIITSGANFNADLAAIWKENFGPVAGPQNMMIKDEKCR